MFRTAQLSHHMDQILSRCLNCFAWPVESDLGLCADCIQRLEWTKVSGWIRYPSLRVNSLFALENDLSNKLIIYGKGNQRTKFWRAAAQQLIRKRLSLSPGLHEYEAISFACAPTRERPRDQAQRLMCELIKYFPMAKTVPLQRHRFDKKAQKDKRRDERQSLEFTLGRPLERFSTNTLFIFVDDVITTGATAYAAYKSLRRPINFEVWTICYRPLLRSASTV